MAVRGDRHPLRLLANPAATTVAYVVIRPVSGLDRVLNSCNVPELLVGLLEEFQPSRDALLVEVVPGAVVAGLSEE